MEACSGRTARENWGSKRLATAVFFGNATPMELDSVGDSDTGERFISNRHAMNGTYQSVGVEFVSARLLRKHQ